MSTDLPLILSRELKRSLADHLSPLQSEAVTAAMEKARKPFIESLKQLIPHCVSYHRFLIVQDMMDSADEVEKEIGKAKRLLEEIEIKPM